MSNRLETLNPKRAAEKELHNALNRVSLEKANRSDGINYFLEMYIKRSFANDTLAGSLLKYILPGVPLISHTTNQQFNKIEVIVQDAVETKKLKMNTSTMQPLAEQDIEYASDDLEPKKKTPKKGKDAKD